MGLVADLIKDVLEEGDLDVPEPRVVRRLSDAHGLMCARSKCFRRKVSLGTVVEGQSDYAVPAEVVEILEVTVGGVPFAAGRHSDIAQSVQHWLWLTVPTGSGFAAADHDTAGAAKLGLFPAPSASGAEIVVYAVCRPAPLVSGEDAGLKIPPEFHPHLVEGAIAMFLRRTEGRHDQAQPFDERFANACVELQRQTARRFKVGPREARLRGINA